MYPSDTRILNPKAWFQEAEIKTLDSMACHAKSWEASVGL